MMKIYRILFVMLCFMCCYNSKAQVATMLINNGRETIELDSVTLVPISFFETKDIRLISRSPQNPKQQFSIGVFANDVESIEYNIEGGNLNYKQNYLDQLIGINTQIVIGEGEGKKVQLYVIRVLP